jgi:hypothetical protein
MLTWREIARHLDRSIAAMEARYGWRGSEPIEARPVIEPPSPSRKPKRRSSVPRKPKPRTRRRAKSYQVLAKAASEAGPPFIRAEIRRCYELLSGRAISLQAVTRFLVEELGLPKVRPGEHAGGRDGIENRRLAQAGSDEAGSMSVAIPG